MSVYVVANFEDQTEIYQTDAVYYRRRRSPSLFAQSHFNFTVLRLCARMRV
jgi:hypothetical protein